MAKIKGIGMVGIAKALRSRRDDAARVLPESLHHYLDERISISEWYPEQDYLALLRVYVEVWPGRTFEEVGRLAANEALSTVYRNILIGGVTDAVKRMKFNWQNYHDSGELNSEVLPGLIRVRVRGYGMKARELCALNEGYFAELLRLSGAEVTALRKPQCASNGDRECVWEFEWRAADRPPGA
jgi:predicted hydrocarbon binding protein